MRITSFFSDIVAGMTTSVLVVLVAISSSTLLFSGELISYLGIALCMTLLGTIVVGIAAARTLHSGVMIAPQNNIAVFASVMTVGLMRRSGLSAEQMLTTLVTALMVTSILLGVFFWLLGHFKLARIARRIPRAVMAGFLATTGWLIVKGSLGVMVDQPLMAVLLSPNWGLLVSGVLLGVGLFVIGRKIQNSLAIVLTLLVAIAVFYVTLYFGRYPFQAAIVNHWLPTPLDHRLNGLPPQMLMFAQFDWRLFVTQTANLSVVLIFASVDSLLSLSGIEMLKRCEFGLNRELKRLGAANIVTGLLGGMATYPSNMVSSLGHKLGARGRTASLTVVVVSLAILLSGGIRYVAYVPHFVVGALLLQLGLNFLYQWLWLERQTFTPFERAVVWVVLIAGASTSILIGVVAGIIMLTLRSWLSADLVAMPRLL